MRIDLRQFVLPVVAVAAFVCGGSPVSAQTVAPRQVAALAGPQVTQEAPSAANLWQKYKERFILADGRLQDIDNGRISHSEGQGYGMLLAVLNDDRATFERMWGWTAENLFVRGDNLAAWRWRPEQGVTDRNNATDGDLLIAWALARAARKWNLAGHAEDARQIAFAVAQLVRYSPAYGYILPPGANGFDENSMKDGPVVNLSYSVLPAFDELARIAPEIDWASLRSSSVEIIKRSRIGKAGLPSDWVSLAANKPAAAHFKPAYFGYDAIRIPLYLAWSQSRDSEALAIFGERWKDQQDLRPVVVDVINDRKVENFWDSSYRAVVALTRCAVYGEAFPASLQKVDFSHYYPSTLHMLSLAALRERNSECGAAVAVRM